MIRHAAGIDSGGTLDGDVCIVGAGAAGITLALQLRKTRLRVILLEAGGEKPDEATQSLYGAEVADPKLHAPGDRYRVRRFGGSTTIWGGRCVPFDPLDFERRPWICEHGWPIGYDEVARYYPQANALCEAGDYAYDAASALPGPMRPMIRGFDPPHFSTDGIERFSCPTDFAARYRHRLAAAANVEVVLGANATELLTSPDGARIDAVAVRTLTRRCFRVTARQVVLAAGGLEIPRLLLASRSTHPAGLGNTHDQVGRHYMCHMAGTLGAVTLEVPRSDVFHGYEIADDGTYCRRRLALRPQVQREHGLTSAVMRLHFPSIVDPAHRTAALSALYLAKPFISPEYATRLAEEGPVRAARWLRHALNVAADPVGLAGFTLHWLRRRTLAARKFPSVVVANRTNRFSLDYHAEQQPDPSSRVTLSGEADALGMPKLRIDWRYGALDLHTARESLRLLAADLAAWGRGRLEYEPERVGEELLRHGAYGGHHIGTTRMSLSPAAGVVDTDARVHGLANLYIAGSAVFPTSGQANPTLTIVAMALRLAAHLQRQAASEATLRAAP